MILLLPNACSRFSFTRTNFDSSRIFRPFPPRKLNEIENIALLQIDQMEMKTMTLSGKCYWLLKLDKI